MFVLADEFLVGLAFLFDERFQARANLRNFGFEFLDGLLPFRDGGRSKFEAVREDFYEVIRIGGFSERIITGAYGLVCWLEGQARHGWHRKPQKVFIKAEPAFIQLRRGAADGF